MFHSTLGKGIAITLAIFGIVSLAAKMDWVTQNNEEAKDYHQKYIAQTVQDRATAKERIKAENAQWKYHSLLEDIGRSVFSIKRSVESYNNQHSEWPEDMTELGLESEKAADGKNTQAIKIDNGEIYAFLMPKHGNKKIIRFFYTGNRQNKWSCTTNMPLNGKASIAGMPCSEVASISFNGRYFQ